MCARIDARSITTIYSYDALNRVTSKTYNDGLTPPANFYYDESSVSLGSCSNSSMSNPVGRLTHTTTGSPGAYLSATVQDYDLMGRVSGYWQAIPSYRGASMWATLYNYDLAGDATSWVHPAGFTITQAINGARQISQVTSSVNDATTPWGRWPPSPTRPLAESRRCRTAALAPGVRRCGRDLPVQQSPAGGAD